MNRLSAVLFLLLLPAASHCLADLVDSVDPFIGTGAHGHTFPGPSLPFGMVQLSPDTRLIGWDGCSAYHFTDRVVYGFSHTHLSGTGVSDYGDILFMPLTGEPMLENGYPDSVDSGYGSRFDKSSEKAEAGYYAVHLKDYDIGVELTATARTGLHLYRLPAGRQAHLVVDLRHRDKLLDSSLRMVDKRTIEGFRRSSAWARDQVVYFQARFSKPFLESEWHERIVEGDNRIVLGVLSFGDSGGELTMQMAVSAVDLEGAARNLDAEWADFDFDKTRAAARAAWDKALGRFTLEGAGEDDRTIFATALYHSFLAPNLFSDTDGRYRGMDGEVHRAENRNHYTVFSLWDTYRATHPLFTLVERERTADFIGTFLAQFEQGGRLPVWELAANETDCMIGYHSVSVIADAYLKGVDRFNAESALDAMIHSADLDHFGLDAYKRDGFIEALEEHESVSKTLEYAYDDACIARMAAALSRRDVADRFETRSRAWRHLFDSKSRFFRPRRNGQWLEPYDPRRVDNHYTEANGWQYRFAAPQHVREHIELFGGDEQYEAALDSLFLVESETTGRDQADITGLIGQYAHGNEPSHHIAWLSHFTGRPERSAERVGGILDQFYTSAPDGLIGNEDCGQMSSWYVLAALGLYDVAPTSNQWLIVPPKHKSMSVRFEDGRLFTTRREGNGSVERVSWNGDPLERSYLTHKEVIAGGELIFHMGEEGRWGRAPDDRPGEKISGIDVVPAPYAIAPSDRFRETMEVALAVDREGAVIRWTDRDDVDPRAGQLYKSPIRLGQSSALRFVAQDGDRFSPVVTARFDAIEHDWQIDIESVPNSQYTAGGPDALIDGRRGHDEWRKGMWHGYQAHDFEAVLNLGEPTPVRAAGAGFLQDMRSWIWMPVELIVDVSVDGETFRPAGRAGHDVPDDEEGIFLRDLMVELDGQPIRALRFRAPYYGVIPDWHPGAGGEAFIFIDELIVEQE